MTSTLKRSAAIGQDRLFFLDWLRILAFAVLVVYHVGMYYVTWDFHIKSPYANAALEPWMRLSAPWRMDLLFLISGAATFFLLQREGVTTQTLWARIRRLLVPLLFGVLVIVPPQSWMEVVQKLGYAGSYWTFLGLYLTGCQDFCFAPGKCLILPTWNHLWFLAYVLVYTPILWLVLSRWPVFLDRLANWAQSEHSHTGWMIWPIVYLVLTRLLLGKPFPVSHALWGDWFAHSQHMAFFILGAVAARAPQFWVWVVKMRWAAFVAALASWYLLVFANRLLLVADLPFQLGGVLFYSCQQWCAIVAALGFARLHLNRDGPLRRYLSPAVFPVYILHQTLIMVLANTFAPLKLPAPLEGVLLAALTLALSLAAYEMIQRQMWARPLFGIRITARHQTQPL